METPSHPTPAKRELAGIGARFVALLIDSIIVGIAYGVLFAVFGFNGHHYTDFDGYMGSDTNGAYNMVRVAIELAYGTYFIGQFGATWGKQVMGIEVVTEDGTKPSFNTAFIRAFVSLISGAVFALGYIWAFFNPRKQTWHDLAARTFVVRRVES